MERKIGAAQSAQHFQSDGEHHAAGYPNGNSHVSTYYAAAAETRV